MPNTHPSPLPVTENFDIDHEGLHDSQTIIVLVSNSVAPTSELEVVISKVDSPLILGVSLRLSRTKLCTDESRLLVSSSGTSLLSFISLSYPFVSFS
jgi:hypothetical protein